MRVWFDTLGLAMEKSWGAVALMETACPAQKRPPGRFSAAVAFSAGGVDQDGEMDSSQLILFQRLRHGYEKGAARTAGSNDCGEVSSMGKNWSWISSVP